MTQTITTDAQCQFLTFLDDRKEERIYPPLRMYKDKHFLFVDGKDKQQISISRTDFEVLIDGVLYTDISAAEVVLDVAIDCVNSASGGGVLDPDAARKAQQLLQIQEAIDTNTELDLVNENLREKDITNGVATYFLDLFVTQFSTFAFPKDIFEIRFLTPFIETVTFPTVTINNIDEFLLLFNAKISSVVLSKKTDSELWINDGTETVASLVGGGAAAGFWLNTGPSANFYQAQTWTTALKQVKEDPLSNIDFIEVAVNELLEKTEIHSILPSTFDPVVISGNVAEVALLANPNRKQATIYVTGGDLWIRQMLATTEPSNRKGIRVIEDGASYDFTPHADNGFYRGEYSVINIADGLTPTFYVTESI